MKGFASAVTASLFTFAAQTQQGLAKIASTTNLTGPYPTDWHRHGGWREAALAHTRLVQVMDEPAPRSRA